MEFVTILFLLYVFVFFLLKVVLIMAYALKTFLDFLFWNCLKSLCYFILLSNLEF